MTCPIETRCPTWATRCRHPPRRGRCFLPGRVSGNLLFLSGQICEWEGVPQYFGPIGPGLTWRTGRRRRGCAR